MAHDLHHLVRATFNNANLDHRNETVAFERAVETLMRRRPLLTEDEARREVATMLGVVAEQLLGDSSTVERVQSSDAAAEDGGATMMSFNLHRAVRSAYRNSLAEHHSEAEAFNRAVELLMEHDPLVGRIEARRRVARMLAQEPAASAPAAALPRR